MDFHSHRATVKPFYWKRSLTAMAEVVYLIFRAGYRLDRASAFQLYLGYGAGLRSSGHRVTKGTLHSLIDLIDANLREHHNKTDLAARFPGVPRTFSEGIAG